MTTRAITNGALTLALTLTAALPARAQTLPPSPPAPVSSTGNISIGAVAGIAAVQNVGGLAGGRLGYQVSPKLQFIGDATWLQDTVTRRRLDSASSVAGYLQSAQGAAATGTVVEPTWSFRGGAQFTVATHGTTEFYVAGEVGAARVVLQPTFTLGSSDVTTTLPSYGVVLGSDLAGTSTVADYSGGVGVRLPHGVWNFDVGVHVESIRTPDQPSLVIGASIAVMRRF
jgi:hypothetical protein